MSSAKSTDLFLKGVTPYGLAPDAKRRHLTACLRQLLDHHYGSCPGYAALVDDWTRHDEGACDSVETYPFLPVTVFKEFSLRSTRDKGITVESSSTTTGTASRIFVDRATKKRQAISASRVMSDFIGGDQRPFIVFDVEQTVRGTSSLSARGAAILSLAHHANGFYFVARQQNGALELDEVALSQALSAIGSRPFIAYGFTYVLYQLHQEILQRGLPQSTAHPDSVLLHSGGWKRLSDQAVDKAAFNHAVAELWGLPPTRVIDFYGSVEQVGVPYPDCPEGVKHAPYWADVIIRRPDTLAPARQGETGLIQLISGLPLSAPNHSVLTEDLGRLERDDGCPCGRRGKVFSFQGRAPKSEVRGCSDAYQR